MAKYRTTDVAAGQGTFLAINLKEQLLPGTYEHMLNEIIGTKIDLSIFDKKYKNDLTGASAVPPSVLLKLIYYGYKNGCISSRKIYELNNKNITAKALTGDMEIHWTTIADFISGNKEEITEVFVQVLMYCNELGLIGGENYAIDGLRLPSNASIDMSGTEEQLKKRLITYKKMAEKHIERHARKDAQGTADAEAKKRFEKRQRKINRQIEKISTFLDKMKKREGRSGEEIQSNVTDNKSAIIHSTKGYIQGYIGIAVSDQKSQVITSAQAVGTANEGEHLPLMLDKNNENIKEAGVTIEEGKKPTMCGDPNYFSEDNLKACEERGIEAVIASGRLPENTGPDGQERYNTNDFIYHEDEDSYECPYGKRLTNKGTTVLRNGEGKIYQASLTDCRQCPTFSKCMKSKKAQDELKQGKKILISERSGPESFCNKMRKKLETVEYQDKYANRIQIVEPVFANIRYCKGLNRFTLRGEEKVNIQWLLFCMVHNLCKCLNGRNAMKNAA
ncbi:MAG: transposase [Treponema sp.]|nr:transposase [Treponema sp.]